MKKIWEKIDDALRHRSVLGRHTWLRNVLRRPYHWLLGLNPSGYSLRLGGSVDVRLPPEFRSKLMETYEAEEFAEIGKWCSEVEDGWFVDVGSSVGYMSCAALFANSRVRVIAIDTDANSLKSVTRVCRHGKGDRLQCIRAMITEESSGEIALDALERDTREVLANPAITGDPGSHVYVNLDDPSSEGIIRVSLDDLLRDQRKEGKPILIKMDIEGAEFGALKGMSGILAEQRAVLLLSVHPEKLAAFGSSRDQVADLLDREGYRFREIARDHELHWLCHPAGREPGD